MSTPKETRIKALIAHEVVLGRISNGRDPLTREVLSEAEQAVLKKYSDWLMRRFPLELAREMIELLHPIARCERYDIGTRRGCAVGIGEEWGEKG